MRPYTTNNTLLLANTAAHPFTVDVDVECESIIWLGLHPVVFARQAEADGEFGVTNALNVFAAPKRMLVVIVIIGRWFGVVELRRGVTIDLHTGLELQLLNYRHGVFGWPDSPESADGVTQMRCRYRLELQARGDGEENGGRRGKEGAYLLPGG